MTFKNLNLTSKMMFEIEFLYHIHRIARAKIRVKKPIYTIWIDALLAKIAGSQRSLVQTFAKVYTKSSTIGHNLSPECEVNAVSKKNEGVIVSYARGPKTQKPKECILSFPSIKSGSEAIHLIGRKVAWPIGKHKARGKIVAFHGRNGLVRARFRKGVPGQALGSLVEIVG